MSRRWFEFKAEGTGPAEIYIYDLIGKCWWGDDDPDDPTMSSTKFIRQLAELGSRPVNLRVNSLGGDPLEAHAIANAITRYPGTVTAYIDSIAASAASEVVCACPTVVIAPNALLMIHKAVTWEVGNADEMRSTASVLDKMDQAIATVYATKTGKPVTAMLTLMTGPDADDGTWFTAEEALAAGLVDQIGETAPVMPMNPPMDFAASGIRSVPKRFAARLGVKSDWTNAGRRNSADDEALLVQARDNINVVLGDIPDEPDGDPDDSGMDPGCEEDACKPTNKAKPGDTTRKVGADVVALLSAASPN